MKPACLAGVFQALLAAVLFGASAPLSKLLLGEVRPVPLAAFLYLGSGTGAFLMLFFQRIRNREQIVEANISRNDLPWLAGALSAGGKNIGNFTDQACVVPQRKTLLSAG